jgi:hypothetical protein
VVLTTLRSQPDAEIERELDEIHGRLQRLVRVARPRSASGDAALAVAERFSQIQRVASSGVALYAPVVVETGSFAKEGHTSAPDWLGSVSGSSASAAKSVLSAAGRAAASPELTEALHEGELSNDQLKLVTKTAAEVKGVTGDLLGLIRESASLKEVTDTAEQMRAAARSRETEKVRRDRVHATRHFRWHKDEDGGIRFAGSCDEVAWSHVAPVLEAQTTARWKAAGSSREPLEAYRLDAFIDMMASGPIGDAVPDDPDDPGDPDDVDEAGEHRSRSGRPRTVVIINAESLRRGTTQGDELCEIDGIGTVSVAAATELIGEGGLQYLIKEGFDIKTMTRSTRYVNKYIDTALLVRDRVCARPGCGKRLGLERDHWQLDYGKDGPTELANLVRLCPECHKMKTDGGWRLTGGPGHWGWVGPEDPPSAGRIARNRKVTVAKARAGVVGDRNRPRRT